MVEAVRESAADPTANFERLESERLAGEPAWLRDARRAAVARFRERGFPSTREEGWRYTNVARIAEAGFRPVTAPAGVPDPGALEPHFLPDAHRLVFVDGSYVGGLSGDPPPEGVSIVSIASALAAGPHAALLEERLGRIADAGAKPFTALNTALFVDGALVHLRPDAVLDRPIQLLFVATCREAPAAVLPRVLVVAEESSRATIVESHTGSASGPCLVDAVTEVHAGPGASVDFYLVQDADDEAFHLGSLEARLERDASLRCHVVSFGAAIARTEVDAVFAGEGATAELNGLYVVDGKRHADCQTFVDHAVPHCTSLQSWRGVLDGRSRGVFNGRVLVRPDAQRTDARQSSKNLILSDKAVADSKPQLEIHADDVRCAHGATIGQLEEEAVFYLRSRGIDEPTARGILTLGFAREILDGIRVAPLRAQLETALRARLATRAPEPTPQEANE